MKKKKYQVLALLLASAISNSLSGCGKDEVITEETISEPVTFEENNAYTSEEIKNILASVEIEEELPPTYTTNFTPTIIATEKTSINSLDGNILGYLKKDGEIEYIDTNDDGNYLVNYYGDYAYIDKNFVIESKKATITGDIIKMFYTPNTTTLTIPDYLSLTGEKEEVEINALECFEVYAEIDDYYLVSTLDYVGYIKKDDLVELVGTFVVVDISNQELRLYEDNELIIKCPVVTGTPTESRHTDEGFWAIHTIGKNYALKGAGYSSPVDIMLKFHGNEGLHDAEYHSCEYWQSKGLNRHGWRDASEFGGDTYLTDGSHGCVNMRHDDVFFVADYVDIDTPVLVKK